MSFAARAQASAARLVGHFGGGFTVTVRRQATTVNANTGGVSSSSYTDYDFPAVVLNITEDDLEGSLAQSGDRLVVLDTSAAAITVTDDDELVINSSVVAVRQLLPLKPGDTLSTVRLHTEGF